jgi:hypothetical protein
MDSQQRFGLALRGDSVMDAIREGGDRLLRTLDWFGRVDGGILECGGGGGGCAGRLRPQELDVR